MSSEMCRCVCPWRLEEENGGTGGLVEIVPGGAVFSLLVDSEDCEDGSTWSVVSSRALPEGRRLGETPDGGDAAITCGSIEGDNLETSGILGKGNSL